MKQLILVRHAKSSWAQSGLDDIDRPLNVRGLHDAPLMANRIAAHADKPELIICSPALRARATAEIIAEALAYSQSKIIVEKNLYCFDANDLLEAIQHFDNTRQRILSVGHNPATTELVNRLCHVQIDNVPTCGVCYLQANTEHWNALVDAELVEFDYPKRHYYE